MARALLKEEVLEDNRCCIFACFPTTFKCKEENLHQKIAKSCRDKGLSRHCGLPSPRPQEEIEGSSPWSRIQSLLWAAWARACHGRQGKNTCWLQLELGVYDACRPWCRSYPCLFETHGRRHCVRAAKELDSKSKGSARRTLNPAVSNSICCERDAGPLVAFPSCPRRSLRARAPASAVSTPSDHSGKVSTAGVTKIVVKASRADFCFKVHETEQACLDQPAVARTKRKPEKRLRENVQRRERKRSSRKDGSETAGEGNKHAEDG